MFRWDGVLFVRDGVRWGYCWAGGGGGRGCRGGEGGLFFGVG